MKNKFGLFIHWGVYSAYAEHEQILAKKNIPYSEYEKRAMEFNPVDFNPEEWVVAAKNAGMKYICFTAKHHDGFCMWDTKYTDYNIMKSAYGKDILKMLSNACRKYGMLLSIYYSNPDWHHLDAYNPNSTHQWRARFSDKSDYQRYIEYKKNQIRELLTNYGEIYTLFWDIPPHIEDTSLNDFVHSIQPNILINDRGHDKGDYDTIERVEPQGERFTILTEACQSIGEQSWAYRADEDYYSLRYLMSLIDGTMARGGNFLLNIGSMGNGKFSAKSLQILEKIGEWYKRMDGALEEHNAERRKLILSAQDYILSNKNNRTYIHLYRGHFSTALNIYDGLNGEIPVKAKLLNDGRLLRIRYDYLPYQFNEKGICERKFVSICDIPCDEFSNEPLVIELSW